MKLSITALLMILMISSVLADQNKVNERSEIKLALNNGDIPAVKKLVENTKYFEVWADALEALPTLNDQKTSKTLLKSALKNPHLWEVPSIEPGETYSARAGTFARTKVELKGLGLDVSSVDLTSLPQRMTIAKQL